MALRRIDSVMALKRALSHRSFFGARCYQPYHNGVVRPDSAHAEKPYYSSFLHQRSFGSLVLSHHLRSSSRLSLCTPFGVSLYHCSMSTAHVPGSDENDVTGSLTDSVLPDDVSSQTITVIKSSSDTAMDSLIDGVQQIIGNVHSFTGLNWWASIVLTTLLIRGLTVPLLIQTKKRRAMTGMLVIEVIAQADMKDQGVDLAALAERFAKGKRELEKKWGVINSVSRLWAWLQLPALFCMLQAINNMTEKEASFKTGGALWFTDLTTPDALYIFPILTGLTFWIAVEHNVLAQKPLRYGGVILVVLWGMDFSQAVHCYWIGCMLSSIAFMHVIRRPGMKKLLGIPHVPEYVMTWKRWEKDTFGRLVEMIKK